jgi:hypothetical protein
MHKCLAKDGTTEPEKVCLEAEKVAKACAIWQQNPQRERKRDPAVAWLLRSTLDWVENARRPKAAE